MEVTSRSLNSYRKAVDEQAQAARRYVMKALSMYFEQNPGASTAEARGFAIELLKASMPNFCDAAGTLAADFFDEVCEAEGIEVSSRLYDTTDYDIVEDKVRYFAERLNDDDVNAFKREVVDATHYFVKRSAYDNMIKNCEANDVRYARVPSGFETCGFCLMLASRGFVYHGEEEAGLHGFHDNCDCCIVPGKKGRTVIEGYDPKGMDERWQACERAIGGDEQARAEWEALPQEKRDEYINRDGSASKAFRRFKMNRIISEAETRDWYWLYTGTPPRQDYSLVSRDSYGRFFKEPNRLKKPDPADYALENFRTRNSSGEWKDLFAHDVLRWNGYGFTARPKDFRGPNGKTLQNASSPDLAFQRGIWGRGYLWEIKSPENPSKPPVPGKELNFISNAFEDAKRRNFKNPHDPYTNEPVTDWDGKRRVVLNTRYRPIDDVDQKVLEKIRSEMRYWQISEVIWIDHKGRLVHLK